MSIVQRGSNLMTQQPGINNEAMAVERSQKAIP
jgi:hypothetical protein